MPTPVAGSNSTVPSRASAGPSKYSDMRSSSASDRVTVSAGSGAIAGSTRNCAGVVESRERRADPNCITWPVESTSATGKSVPGMHAADKRLVRPNVVEDVVPRGTPVKSTMTSARSSKEAMSSQLP